jgi:hypothetical protein
VKKAYLAGDERRSAAARKIRQGPYVTIILMTTARRGWERAVPLLLLLALYWPAVTAWFFQDDFGWLNLHHDVRSARDLAPALFAPKAHGNMRPLGENAYWLVLPAVFGADPLPLHIAAFLTQCASLLLLGSIVRRLTESRLAAFAAQILWMANIGLAPALGWSSIYNQVLSAFFFLLAFYFLLRYVESGRRVDWAAQWIAFLLGLGALEINVVYPALACVYALLFARKLVRRVLPMFAVSALAVFLHFYFAPPAASGVYAPVFDGRVFQTTWTYWSWALGPMPIWLTILLTAGVCLLIAADILRRRYAALLGFAWFLIPLVPYLPLPDHKMDYYLAVPAIGIALMGAVAIGELRSSWHILAAICAFVYLAASLPKSWTTAQWEHARGERMENLVLGVEEVRQAAPQKIILLEGIDTDFFFSGIADLPFRALEIPHVYLAPAEFGSIQAPRELLSKYILPPALARRALDAGTALLYCFDGQMLHRSNDAVADEEEPHFVNIADDVFRDYLGSGWSDGPGGLRVLKGTATVRIGGPRTAADYLYIGVFETHDFHLSVAANGVELPVERVSRNTDLSEYRAALPADALEWQSMQVALSADRSPVLFGYVEVR